jgi:hypothetical protein
MTTLCARLTNIAVQKSFRRFGEGMAKKWMGKKWSCPDAQKMDRLLVPSRNPTSPLPSFSAWSGRHTAVMRLS